MRVRNILEIDKEHFLAGSILWDNSFEDIEFGGLYDKASEVKTACC